MLGEHYASIRGRLGSVARGAANLASATGTELGPLGDLKTYLSPLREPWKFLVCGETNAGKSAFINGLFGYELCESAAIPTTQELTYYSFSKRESEGRNSRGFLSYKCSAPALRDFAFYDTPGLNRLSPESKEQLLEMMGEVDFVFFILPSSNPWSASTWSLIVECEEELRDRMMVVLQQADTLEEKDLEVMQEHLSELSLHKIGESIPVYPVSANLAMVAKERTPPEAIGYKASGYAELERLLNRKIGESLRRREALQVAWDQASEVLRDIETRMDVRRRTLSSDQGFLADIENEVNSEREHQAQLLSENFNDLAAVFGDQSERAHVLLKKRTTIGHTLRSLFKADSTATEIERNFIEAVQSAIEGKATRDGKELVELCRGHWQTVIPRVEERLEMPPPDFEAESEGLAGTQNRFAKALGEAAKRAVTSQKIRTLLEHEMNAQRGFLRRFVISSLLLITIGGVFGAVAQHLLGGLFVLAALVLFGCGLVGAKRMAREISATFLERVALSRHPFAEHLVSDYQEGVRGFFVEYAQMFEGIRRHVADLKMKLKPQQDRWSAYFVELNSIDQDR